MQTSLIEIVLAYDHVGTFVKVLFGIFSRDKCMYYFDNSGGGGEGAMCYSSLLPFNREVSKILIKCTHLVTSHISVKEHHLDMNTFVAIIVLPKSDFSRQHHCHDNCHETITCVTTAFN